LAPEAGPVCYGRGRPARAGKKRPPIGLDIAKNVFQVHGVDETGQPALRRKLRRAEVLRLFYHLEPALVGIEACHAAHHPSDLSHRLRP